MMRWVEAYLEEKMLVVGADQRLSADKKDVN
jgi:hypothetical protein